MKVEDHCRLQHQVKELLIQVQIEVDSALLQCKTRLSKISVENLRGIACKLLSCVSIDSHGISFHKDICNSRLNRRRDLTPNLIHQHYLATARRYEYAKMSKL